MAQKKVILKDGSNDLLPKTLASMVFTEAGQTVEAALKKAGGGGSSSGGGTGNVKVTNASSLNKDNYYAFKPSANGSVEGTFSTIPDASESKAGLMSSPNYEKLGKMKSVIALPVSVLEYNAETTSETIESMLQTAFGLNADNAAARFLYTAAVLQGEYNKDFEKFYIGDRECMLGGNAVTDGSSASQATLEFSYVDGGKLHTVAITMVVSGESGNQTYTYSAKVLESGDDTYYLGGGFVNFGINSTHEDILAAFGGSLDGIAGALKAKKKIFVFMSVLGTINYILPVNAYAMGSSYVSVFFPVNNTGNIHFKNVICSASNSDQSRVHNIYPSGYSLKPSLYTLTSSSTSNEISTAVGGESGLKEIIQAVKDGNRLVIRGAYSSGYPITSSTEVISVSYAEGENGDLQLLLSYWIYPGIGATHKVITIAYTKSSNTFAVSAQQDIS